MAKLPVNTLSRVALNWAVAFCEKKLPASYDDWTPTWPDYTKWENGGEVVGRLLRDGLTLQQYAGQTSASINTPNGFVGYFYDADPLIAALRCKVACEIGPDVEVPDDLLITSAAVADKPEFRKWFGASSVTDSDRSDAPAALYLLGDVNISPNQKMLPLFESVDHVDPEASKVHEVFVKAEFPFRGEISAHIELIERAMDSRFGNTTWSDWRDRMEQGHKNIAADGDVVSILCRAGFDSTWVNDDGINMLFLFGENLRDRIWLLGEAGDPHHAIAEASVAAPSLLEAQAVEKPRVVLFVNGGVVVEAVSNLPGISVIVQDLDNLKTMGHSREQIDTLSTAVGRGMKSTDMVDAIDYLESMLADVDEAAVHDAAKAPEIDERSLSR